MNDIKSKRIGVMTHWWTQTNYGQILQAYALKMQLSKLGYDSYIIRYDIFKALKQARIKNIFSINAWLRLIVRILTNKVRINKKPEMVNRNFDEFKNEDLNFSDTTYSNLKELRQNPPKADIYIVGSDQVWLKPSQMGPYLLDFGGSEIRRIAYAASFGRSQLAKKEFQITQKLANNFYAIGVREITGKKIFKEMNYEKAQLVPDPTMLLDKNEWVKIKTQSNYFNENKNKVFVYIIGQENNETIHKIANSINNDRNTVYVCADGHDKMVNAYPSIGEWIDLVLQSDFIITNSFHGTIFSLIFNKDFITVGRIGEAAKMNVRTSSLLEKIGLKERLVDKFEAGNIKELSKNPIDWDQVNKEIQVFKTIGINFLTDALQ